jgi:hydrogenase maturation factor
MQHLLAGAPPAPPEVRLGPAVGEDAAAIAVAGGVLVAATDPITMTGDRIGRYAVTINANDVAVTGVRPRWFLATVLFPVGTTPSEVVALFDDLHRAGRDAGVALVGGHTEVSPSVNRAVVVGHMLGLAEDGRFIRTGGSSVGDAVVQVGPAPIEGAAVLAAEAAGHLGGLDAGVVGAAAAGVEHPGISVVEPALCARRLGATAMHDPTEGGLASGLHELATAAGLAVRVRRHRVLWWEPGIALCAAVGADPLATLASGTLLAVFPARAVDAATAGLTAAGFAAAVIGWMEHGRGVLDTSGTAIALPARDEIYRVLEVLNGGTGRPPDGHRP